MILNLAAGALRMMAAASSGTTTATGTSAMKMQLESSGAGIIRGLTRPSTSRPSSSARSRRRIAEAKVRTFTQARQAVKAKSLSRGFYPFSPHLKGKKCKGKGSNKGKSKGKGFGAPLRPQTPVLYNAETAYAVGPADPGFTGCFVCGRKDHSFRQYPTRIPKGKGKGKSSALYSGTAFMVESEEIPESSDPLSGQDAVLLQTSQDREDAGFGIIDCGATETVGSLPALESLMLARFRLCGQSEEVEVSAAPAKRFKFGNGTHSMSASCILVPRVGDMQLKLQLYTLDCEGVPILIGMRTLRRLKAVVDFSKSLAIFVAVNPNLAIPLRRGKTGHLLIDLRCDWLQHGF